MARSIEEFSFGEFSTAIEKPLIHTNKAVSDASLHGLHRFPSSLDDLATTPVDAAALPANPLLRAPRILFVTSEHGDYIKAGGLGEVSAALPLSLGKRCDVRVLIPGYRQLRDRHPQIDVVKSMPATAHLPPWSLGRVATAEGLTVYIVLCDELYNRIGSPYGSFDGEDWLDNDIRFARLSLAAAEIAAGEADPNWKPDIVHVNDWPSALTAGYMNWKGLSTPSILTIHNLAYQGIFESSRTGLLGIPDSAFSMKGVEFHGKMSFLKSGIFYASHITTVSETYAREITTAEHGCGLNGLLSERMHEGRLTGILNGIDESWVPPANSDARSFAGSALFKRKAADDIRKSFGLGASDGPIFAVVSRLVHQKGIDLSIDAAKTIIERGGQMVVTGRGEASLERDMIRLAETYPGKIGVKIGFSDVDARSMFTGSDFLLMPSRFEPCGLSQMYAQKLGALPIAHSTGGLADTIDDGRSGFLFSNLSSEGLVQAVNRALRAFSSKPSLRRMRKHAMAKSFGWSNSAKRYSNVYRKTLTA